MSEYLDNLTAEQEQKDIDELKDLLLGVIAENGYLSGNEKSQHIAIYACMEIAAQIQDPILFIAIAEEVYDVAIKGRRT
jgi:hypothetical protein